LGVDFVVKGFAYSATIEDAEVELVDNSAGGIFSGSDFHKGEGDSFRKRCAGNVTPQVKSDDSLTVFSAPGAMRRGGLPILCKSPS
jgi:hypothetical protein